MKKELTRKQMITLIASDYGFGPEITEKLSTTILKETCESSIPFIYLQNLLMFYGNDIFD